jgi:hypothetical protein
VPWRQTKVIFSKQSATCRRESERGHGESVEPFDQTVGLSIDDPDIFVGLGAAGDFNFLVSSFHLNFFLGR